MEERVAQVVTSIDRQQEELIQLLKQLVRFETPSPPARNTLEAQNFVANYLKEIGFEVDQWEVYPGDPNVVGVLKGTESSRYKSLILNGHIDVAQVEEGEQWTHPPFDPVVKDGRIYGRGVADMKGGLAAILFALKMIHQHGLRLPGDIIVQSVVGEEVGEAGTLECCRKGYTADFAIVADTSGCQIQGQGGVITGWITVESPETFHDAMRRRMIHAGGSLFGASAIEKMMKIIEGLQELERHWAVTKSYPGFPPGANTINPAVIEGGRHAAFVADQCRLWITVHFYPDEHHEQVAKEIEDHILKVAAADPWLRAHPPTFKWGGQSMIEERGEIFPSLDIDANWPGVTLLRQAHQAIFHEEAQVSMSPTVTDGGWLGQAGIPTVIYGPGDLKEAHAVNESLDLNELVRYTQVLAQFICEWSHTPK